MKKLLLTIVVALVAVSQLRADKGMWLLQLMRQQNLEDQMRKLGLQVSIDEIYSPDAPSIKDAIGIFGGGCTGEVISPNGLVVTNHHCGFGFIQQLSTVEHNYLQNGFWSKSNEEELPCEDIGFTFVVKITDVTDEINSRIASGKITEEQSFSRAELAKIGKELFDADNIEGKKYMYPQLLPYFEANKYYLVYYKKYTDVRLVGTPPFAIGKFGGETDNWMWPRHTGDFSVFRIYADKDGNPAAYSKDNVPLKTPKHLNISIAGVDEGDFAMIMGFPGSTSRYLTAKEVEQRMYQKNEPRIAMRDLSLKVIREEMEKSEDINIKYASKLARISNYWKNSIGMNKAIIDNKVLETKLQEEAAFKAWAKSIGNSEYAGRLPGQTAATDAETKAVIKSPKPAKKAAVEAKTQEVKAETVSKEQEKPASAPVAKAEKSGLTVDKLMKADLGMLSDDDLEKGIKIAAEAEEYRLASKLRDELKGRKEGENNG